MATVSLRNIRKRFGKTEILKGVDLEIAEGEFVVVVGPSGCGKTTLLRLIAGLDLLDEGEIRVGDQLMNGFPPAKRDVAMVFQNHALYPHLTVAENLAFGMRDPKQQAARQKIQDIAALLRVQPLLNRKPATLSGGETQRVAIGRAIARDAAAYLFDEPLSNLDVNLRAELRAELARLRDQFQTTTIYVTHDQAEAMSLATRIAVLHQGRIQQIGKPLELYRYPANLFVARCLGSPRMNLLAGVVTETEAAKVTVQLGSSPRTVRLAIQSADVACGDNVVIGIRCEHLCLDANGLLRGTVKLTEQLGADTFVHIQPDETLFTSDRASNDGQPEAFATPEIIVRVDGNLAPPLNGSPVEIGLKETECRLFNANGVAIGSGPIHH